MFLSVRHPSFFHPRGSRNERIAFRNLSPGRTVQPGPIFSSRTKISVSGTRVLWFSSLTLTPLIALPFDLDVDVGGADASIGHKDFSEAVALVPIDAEVAAGTISLSYVLWYTYSRVEL